MKLKMHPILVLLLFPLWTIAADSQFICPPDLTISCAEFRYLNGDYSSLGEPQYTAYCITDLQVHVDDKSNFCGIGQIKRTWTAFDICSWVPVSCTQVIEVVAPTEDWVIQFPPDLSLECTAVQDLPNFGEPILMSDRCEDIRVNYQDQIFDSVEDACYKVVRTWTAINWCTWNVNIGDRIRERPELQLLGNTLSDDLLQDLDGDGDEDRRTYQVGVNNVNNLLPAHDPNYIAPDTDGYIVHQQVIKVMDSSVPQIDPIADLNICIESGCTAAVELPEVEVFDCSGRISGVWTTDIDDLSAVPAGDYTATYRLTDNCGNFAQQSINIMVADCAPPTSYCRDLSVDLMITQEVEIWASDFNVGSFDDCSAVQLAFSPNPRDTGLVFTCDNLGYNTVKLYTLDPAGNYSTCNAVVYVGDSQRGCPFGEPARLVGTIFTPDFDYVSNVNVHLNGNGTQTIRTNELGFYDMRGITRLNDYTITPSLDTLASQGVDETDLELLIHHVMGTKMITNPYRLLAADVDRSGQINTSDIVAMRRIINGSITHFPNNTAWRFIPRDYQWQEGANPLNIQLPDVVNINNLDEDLMVVNFFAIKIGDINGSWSRTLSGASTDATATFIQTAAAVTAYPNPFEQKTTLRFHIAQSEQVRLTIMDVTGRLIWQSSRYLEQGMQEWDIDGTKWASRGTLWYQLETSTGVLTGKIIQR